MSTGAPDEFYRFVVLCLNRRDGKPVWEKTACETVPHEGHHKTEGGFASGSPITDGQNIFAYFGSRGLFCYDMDGNPRWNKQLGQAKMVMAFGEGSSPALCGDAVIVNWDAENGSFIQALDKKTGDTLWKKDRDEKSSWATPLVVDYDEKKQIIVSGSGKVRAYDPATGDVIWECKGLTKSPIPSPVVGEGLVYCATGYQGSSLLAIKLGGKGDISDTDFVAWRYKKNTPYVPSPLLVDGRLYMFNVNTPALSCLNAKDGAPIIDAQKIAELKEVYASPIYANGRVYLVGRNGTTVVLKSSDKFEVLAINKIDDKFDASPAVVGNELFLRGVTNVYCISEK
jgi:outer membrane protein assembly factor BamB